MKHLMISLLLAGSFVALSTIEQARWSAHAASIALAASPAAAPWWFEGLLSDLV